jgi:hypothetical protein
MNNQQKDLLLITASLLILFTICISQNNNPNTKEDNSKSNFVVVFPMHNYLTTTDNTPYPVLFQDKFNHINTRTFINIMN